MTDFTDPVPAIHRFILCNEISPAASDFCVFLKGFECIHMCRCGVHHMHGIHSIGSIPDDSQFSTGGSLENSRQDVWIVFAPNEMGAKCDRSDGIELVSREN